MGERCRLHAVLTAPAEAVPELELLTVVDQFGDWASWVLAEDVLQRAEKVFCSVGRPDLDVLQQPGACAPLFVTDGSTPCLRRTFALPLRWVPEGKEARGGARVPFGDRVARILGITGWVLRPLGRVAPEVVDFLCAEDFTSWDSAWVPIAIGLLSAEGGWPVRAGVLSTGAWSAEAGLGPVGYVQEKVRLAMELGARQLLLPRLNCEEAQRVLRSNGGSTLELVPLRHGCVRFREVVSPVFGQLPVPPAVGCNEQDQVDYVKALVNYGQLRRAAQYYREAVMPRVASRLRHEWLEATGIATPDMLVTIASASPVAACYSISACRPRSVLLLHDRSMARKAEEIQQMVDMLDLGSERPRIQTIAASDRDDLLRRIRQLERPSLLSTDGPLVVDLTPGTKEMTLELVLSVAQKGDLGIYIAHKVYSSQGAQFVVPHSETLRVWRL